MNRPHAVITAATLVAVASLLLLLPSLRADPAPAKPAEPAASAFSRWPNDPGFFPLAVWLQSPSNAPRYRDLGINTYVALWRGPTDEALDALDKAGMRLICQQSERSLKYKDRKTIIGWMHDDEPDNAQPLPAGQKGYGPPITPEKIVEGYQRMHAADPDRPVMLNLGQGVAFDNYIGRGVRRNHLEDYPEYLKGCDIASFDIYPVNHDHPDVAGKLEMVAKGVSRLREWTQQRKPVWCCIETTHIHSPDKLPTPAQVRSEVWMGLTHGAAGIIYFCHEFSPKSIEPGLLQHQEICEAVKRINAEIHDLAPVLNSPTLSDAATVTSSDPQVPVALLCKQQGGATYLFTVAMRNAPTTASFTFAGLIGDSKVEVLGENRTINAAGGKFEDRFDGYAVHLYRVK